MTRSLEAEFYALTTLKKKKKKNDTNEIVYKRVFFLPSLIFLTGRPEL